MKRLIEFLLLCVMAGFFALMFLEWFVGCGETYIDANGKRHANECLFIGKYVSLTTTP